MNPRSAASSDGGQSPLPVHTHELTPQETLELGEIAIEEPHDVAATGVPAAVPLPPTTVIVPQPVATSQVAVTAPLPVTPPPAPPASSEQSVPAVAPSPAQPPQPSDDQGAMPPPATPAPVSPAVTSPPAVPVPPAPIVAPKTTPSKAPDVPAPIPKPPLEQPYVATDETQPPASSKPIQLSTADRMEMSANSMNIKSVSRLHAIGVAMNIIVIILIAGIVVGGWYVYKYMLGGSGIQL